MSKQQSRQTRKPATKLPHLQKKLQKQQTRGKNAGGRKSSRRISD